MNWTRVDGIARYLESDSTLYVWCSGSDGRADLWRNFDPRWTRLATGERVARTDLAEAWTVWSRVHSMTAGRRVVLIGFSRGAAIAAILARLLPPTTDVSVELYAPKRFGDGQAVQNLRHRGIRAQAQRGDLVPYLPPWFAGMHIDWRGPRMWPWRAHRKVAKAAARRRHEITQRAGGGSGRRT